ncbi:MAG: hypothetical protein HOP19_04390 [Acidobacteria bacterium]|nr:hypothetical protein [Acidobacteriota bacterium]
MLEGLSEPDAMQEAVRREAGVYDLLGANLVLVDGGKKQLRRAQAALPSSVPVLAAVKPPGQSQRYRCGYAPSVSSNSRGTVSQYTLAALA